MTGISGFRVVIAFWLEAIWAQDRISKSTCQLTWTLLDDSCEVYVSGRNSRQDLFKDLKVRK